MEVLLKLNNVESRLLVWGEAFTLSSSPGDVIVTITGNPGIIDFYHEFCLELHRTTEMPVCLVGQAGHDIIPHEKTYYLNDEGYLFDLKGQVEHKLDLINNHIDKQKRLHLIGHSIGAWMIIESMCKDPSVIERVASINLLFPTLQEMAVTKSGFFINKILRKIHVIAMFLIVLLNMLPESVLKMIAAIYLKARSLPVHFTNRVLKYVNPTILDKVLFLAYDEMDSVTALNTDAIDKVKHKINVIYSENDGWVPLKYMEDLKQFQPSLQMTQVAYTHEFVLKSSEEVAEMVSNNIMSKA